MCFGTPKFFQVKNIEKMDEAHRAVLGKLVAASKPLHIARRAARATPPAELAGPPLPPPGAAHADGAEPRRDRQQDKERKYASELDCDFFGTAFETYRVSNRAKREGGGREIGAASAFCGDLTLHIRHCNWIQKYCYGGTGSTRRFCADSLLYLASRDGFFNNIFHHKCDLKGPTVTVVATGDGRLFGGYASTPWSAGTTGKYSDDPGSFLFSLTDGKGRTPVKLGQADASPKDAVFHDPDLGPCWGRALGLQLDILAYSSSDFVGNAKYKLPRDQDDKTFLAGSYNGWDIQEVAVWLV